MNQHKNYRSNKTKRCLNLTTPKTRYRENYITKELTRCSTNGWYIIKATNRNRQFEKEKKVNQTKLTTVQKKKLSNFEYPRIKLGRKNNSNGKRY